MWRLSQIVILGSFCFCFEIQARPKGRFFPNLRFFRPAPSVASPAPFFEGNRPVPNRPPTPVPVPVPARPIPVPAPTPAPIPNPSESNSKTCVFAFHQTDKDEHSPWFEKFAKHRVEAVANIESGRAVPLIAWDTRKDIPTHLFASHRNQCTSLYFIYVGHGRPTPVFYPNLVSLSRKYFPQYRSLVVEDTGCSGMSQGTRAELVRALEDPSIRPKDNQVHSFWGNQLASGPVHVSNNDSTYYSWYGLKQTSTATEHRLWDCDLSRQPCYSNSGSTPSEGFWCNTRRGETVTPVYYQCNTLNGRLAWRQQHQQWPYGGGEPITVAQRATSRHPARH